MSAWRVFWVKPSWLCPLTAAEGTWPAAGLAEGGAVFVGPDHRIDPLLCRFGQSSRFRGFEVETRRNYATDICLLLAFLSARGRYWTQARERDLEDFRSWRLSAPANPARVGASKWNRELAAFTALYTWAGRERCVPANPVTMRRVSEVYGVTREVPAHLVRPAVSDMHWLTPRTWRLWSDIGLRGRTADGSPDPEWAGRLEDRNTAFVELVLSSGLRRQEAGSLLTFEVPAARLVGARYCRGRIAGAVTRSKASHTFYASAASVRDIESYVESSRAGAVRKAQRKGRYDRLVATRLVNEITGGPRLRVRWIDREGRRFEQGLEALGWRERMLLFTEGADGPEPLWLWLNEASLPFIRTPERRCSAPRTSAAALRWNRPPIGALTRTGSTLPTPPCTALGTAWP